MIFAHTGAIQSQVDNAVNTPMAHQLSVEANQTPPALIHHLHYPQSVVPLDSPGHCLRLWEFPSLRLDLVRQGFEIEGWGIQMDVARVTEVPREIARKFLMLWAKSERKLLNQDEAVVWERILDKVDFQRFCTDRAPFRYIEGNLLSRDALSAIVRWHDGREETLHGTCLRALAQVDESEIFSAFVKFDGRERVSEINNVTPLGGAEAILGEGTDGWLQYV